MSKGKRAKSGSAHDINKWENGLVQAVLNEDVWKTCVFFLVSNKPEDNDLINISSEVISTGLRKLFSVISKEQLYKEVKDFAKAIGTGGGKGKPAVKLPEFVEVCEQVKPFIDQGEEIPPSLLAKLLKFKLLLLKSKDIERREEVKKERTKSASGKKGDKRGGSPGKRSKSPKKKTKKGEAERPSSPKKDTKLKRRGEVEDTFKTIDDEPDDEDSPQHYVVIHGFLQASTIQHLANIGVHVNAILKLQQDEYRAKILANVTEETQEDVEDESEETKEEIVDNDVEDESSKDEEELATFWRESEELVFSAPNGHKLKDIAKYEVTVKNTLPSHLHLADIEAEKKNELGTAIFEKIANTCYDMLDHEKSYQRFLAAMKLLHIPVQTPKTDIQSTAVTTDTPEQVEIDMRYYNHLVNSVPNESMSVPLVLHCLLEQVVATVDETDPLAKQTQIREDGLDNDLAAHINKKMTELALSAAEKQDILEADGTKKRPKSTKVPEILDYSDKLSQRLHYLEDVSILDGLDTERAVLDTAAPRALEMFPRRTTAEFMESKARFHQFIQHCSFPSAENVSYLLKKYTFEGMPLKSVDATGGVVEPKELKFPYSIPCDDPYSDFSKYFSARDQGMISDDVDLASVSAAVPLVSFRNLDDWCYVEEFDKTTFTQILEDTRHSHPFVDTYYHKHDDTLLLVYHNPVGKHLQNTSQWTVRLLSNVGFRNYLEHISSMIGDWNLQQDKIEEENNKTPTPVPPTPEPPKTEVKTGSRYGLKTRAEIAALKAEEEDKGKKKGKRSARSKTPKSGRKSSPDKKGKNRTSSAGSPGRGTKASKTRLVQEVEAQPEVDDEGAIEAEEDYDFLGYDVGDNLIHVTGVRSSIFPCDGGEIRVEKIQYVRGANSASISVHKDGNILKLHFLEPLEEILPDRPSEVIDDSKVDSSETCEKTEDDVTQEESNATEEGVEKSEFEANEKTASFHQDVTVESEHVPLEPTLPMFCTHASFVAQLNDGMVITCSAFGSHGKPAQPDGSFNKDSTATVPLDPSPPPKVSSPKSRKKNDEEVRRLEELRLAEEKQRDEEEARRLKELQESIKKPFHEIFVSCPDGLHVSYRNDENFASALDAGGVVTRQCYPLKSRGLHECEAVRGKVAMRELSRSITTDGTVIKIMLDNSIHVLHADGSTSSCPVFPEKSDKPDDRPEPSTQQSSRKAPANNPPVSLPQDEADDQMETTSELCAQWTTVTADGERLVQNLDGSERYLEAVKLSVATCPVTNQIYKTREDNVITVIRPDGTQIVEHSDGTRITTYYDIVRIEVQAADAETGEEAEYESRVCKHVKVECEGFATVVMDTENGSSRTLFGNGSNIHTEANGECVVEKSDGSRLCFDIKGNIAYVPREMSGHGCPSLSDLNDSCSRGGVYVLRTSSQHCCELLDQRGNVFSVYSNGEIKIDESKENGTNMPGNEHKDEPRAVDASSSLPSTPHVPRFFVMHRNGTGYELLRHQDVSEFLKQAEKDDTTAILKTPVESLPGVTGITVLKPFPGGVGKTWLKEKDERILIPVGLRERDFKMFPASEFKKIGPKFGCNAGSALNVGNMRKTVAVKPQITCPKVLVLRHLIQYEPSDSTHRQTISAAFQQYGDYVTKLQLQADGCLPRESRENEEVERADRLTNKYEPMKSNKHEVASNTNGLCQEYVKSVTPAEKPPPPAPEWKRSPTEWERDRIELAKLDYGKHALRFQEVPPYFETAQGQAFLTGLKGVPDMTKLSANLDKQACPPVSTDQQRSGSSSPAETVDHSNATNGHESRDRNDSKSLDRYSSAVLENLDAEGRHSPGDPPIQSSTPFASRPINPTPAQAAGRPTPTASRPTNPTPRQASNVISSEAIDSPRNVQSHLEYTPLEALVETQHEVSIMEDNDTALDLASSTNSQYNEEGRQKSLYVDVTGSPRKDAVRLPNVILGGKPGALPNTQFSTVEDPVRRKVQTVSSVGKNVSNMRGFELFPAEVDFGILKEGCTYIHSVMLKNVGIDSCRFKIRQPPPSTGMKVLFTPGPVAAGMNTKLDIEIFAVAVGVSGESGIGSIGHHVEIVGETDIIYLPITATILTAYEYDNRLSSLPQGYHSLGTQMISNRPPSREAIRPQRDHTYSNVAKHF